MHLHTAADADTDSLRAQCNPRSACSTWRSTARRTSLWSVCHRRPRLPGDHSVLHRAAHRSQVAASRADLPCRRRGAFRPAVQVHQGGQVDACQVLHAYAGPLRGALDRCHALARPAVRRNGLIEWKDTPQATRGLQGARTAAPRAAACLSDTVAQPASCRCKRASRS